MARDSLHFVILFCCRLRFCKANILQNAKETPTMPNAASCQPFLGLAPRKEWQCQKFCNSFVVRILSRRVRAFACLCLNPFSRLYRAYSSESHENSSLECFLWWRYFDALAELSPLVIVHLTILFIRTNKMKFTLIYETEFGPPSNFTADQQQ